jgi:AcrR family transcriptional regulator
MNPKPAASEARAPARRRYTSTRRSAQAAQTRRDVLDAAVQRFGETGWAGTTLAAIAAQAGVAVETIYTGFGSKKGLLRAAMDVAVVGDDQPVALAERPAYRQVTEGPVAQRVHMAAQLVASIHARSAGVWSAIVEAAGADPEVAAWRSEFEHNRRLEVQRAAPAVFGHPVDAAVGDLVWALLGPEVYRKLVDELGLTREEYEARVAEALRRFMTPGPTRP